MAETTVGGTGTTGGGQQLDPGQLDKNREADFQRQLQLMEVQRKQNAQNTLVTALSTMEKGKDDVLRAIANNLK